MTYHRARRLTKRPARIAALAAVTVSAFAVTGSAFAVTGSAQARPGRQADAIPPLPPFTLCSENPPPHIRHPVKNPASVSLAGWSEAGKLNGSALLGEPVNALALGTYILYQHVDDNADACEQAVLQLDYQGKRELPPFRATFLSYGFVPVTATVTLAQPGPLLVADCPTATQCPAPVEAIGGLSNTPPFPFIEWSIAELTMRISDVKVNGVPLNVGTGCHTEAPLYTPDPVIDPDNDLTVLAGGTDGLGNPLPGLPAPPITDLTVGNGTLAGDVTIPPFTGCGADGELDPLLDASISGQGNYIKMTQGVLCYGGDLAACTPQEEPPVGQPPSTGAYR